ncbi:MAG: hypothetical protein WCZ87_06140 [Thiohalobacteraceae bacterium]
MRAFAVTINAATSYSRILYARFIRSLRRYKIRNAKPAVCMIVEMAPCVGKVGADLRMSFRRIYPILPRLGATTVVTVAALFGVMRSASAATCAPAAHWVDACGAGVDSYLVTMRFGIDTDFDAFANVDVTFSGNMQIARSDPYPSNPGASPGHLDRLDTEILSMELTGSGFAEGWTMRAGGLQGLAPTLGFVQEQTSSAALSHFDMVFEFVGTPYGTLHHAGTLFFEASVDQFLPVGAWFRHTGSPFGTTFPLYDSSNVWVLNLEDQIVTDFVGVGRPEFQIAAAVVPVPAALGLFGAGLVALVGVARKTVG